MIKCRLILLLAMTLAGCTATGQGDQGYPSLSKRPVELEAGSASSEAVVSAPMPSAESVEPALLDTLAGLARQAKDSGAAFDRLYAENAGRVRVATGDAVSSESWVAAHVLLGKLEQARNGSVTALASLDVLYAGRMKNIADGKARGGIAEIEAVREPVLATVDSQNERIDALRAVLREP